MKTMFSLQPNLFIYMGSTLFVFSLIAYRWKKSHRRQLRKLKEEYDALQKRFDVLSAQDQTHELLLNEIHHRVKNNLQFASSLLNMQVRSSQQPEVKKALQESAIRFQSMLLVHQKLYTTDHTGHIDVKNYTKDLVHYLIKSYSSREHKIKHHLEIEEAVLPTELVISYGLLLTELITNSVKYARSTAEDALSIYIKLHLQPSGAFEIDYTDNGRGIPEPIDWNKTDTMGLRLLHNLTKQIHGSIRYEFNQGANFKINFRNQ